MGSLVTSTCTIATSCVLPSLQEPLHEHDDEVQDGWEYSNTCSVDTNRTVCIKHGFKGDFFATGVTSFQSRQSRSRI